MNDSARSFEAITTNDLHRLAALGQAQLQRFIAHAPLQRQRFAELHIATVLCQGAGLHYLDGRNGVKDFDLCHFFCDDGGAPFPARTLWNADFGASRFGHHPADIGYTGRRVDIQGRSIPHAGTDSVDSIRHYVRGGKKGSTPWYFAQKGMVVVHPPILNGTIVWPVPRA